MSVTLAITGEHIQSLNESGFVAISENEVTQDEIDDALHTASSVKLPEVFLYYTSSHKNTP